MAAVGSTVVEVAREVVGEVSPAEIAEFDFVARRFADHPRAAGRATRPSNETTASIMDYGGEVLGAVALGITTDLCKDVIKMSAKDGRRRIRALLRREPAVGVNDEVPPIGEEHVETLRSKAVAAVLAAGGDVAVADAIGAALVKSWPRRPR